MTDTVPEDFPDNPELDHELDGIKSLPGFGSMPFLIFIPNREEIILKWKKPCLRDDFSCWRDFRDEIHTEHTLNQKLKEEARERVQQWSHSPCEQYTWFGPCHHIWYPEHCQECSRDKFSGPTKLQSSNSNSSLNHPTFKLMITATPLGSDVLWV